MPDAPISAVLHTQHYQRKQIGDAESFTRLSFGDLESMGRGRAEDLSEQSGVLGRPYDPCANVEDRPTRMLTLQRSFQRLFKLGQDDRQGRVEAEGDGQEADPAAGMAGEARQSEAENDEEEVAPGAAVAGDKGKGKSEGNDVPASNIRPIDSFMPLEVWLQSAAASRTWPIGDHRAASTWDGVISRIARTYVEIQQDRHHRDLVCDNLEPKDLLVRGQLDLTLPRKQIIAANTMEQRLLGNWRAVRPEDEEGGGLGTRNFELQEMVVALIDQYFPQYTSWG